ncbi:CDP-alcohol phosphatidyltransferase family protein [Schaalia sp. Marseille-Q2122]|uniref:CDP-alcohol phosphatidyltransferase family protein n=1 Tax=Schaalia sp. Marseille-Q2122 TaxID=2736604 RepID=UPI00158A2A62|nr:CDP-alcohol phosphatidyltransferase family protein [Schaalia sp. Marseille-Q2122]
MSAPLQLPPNASWPDHFRAARATLDAAQKPGNGVPAYTRWVNRRAARLIASFGAASRMTPNMVTGISFLLSLGGMALMLSQPPHPLQGVGVAVLLALGYIFDSADGQLARLTGRSSKAGEWLDHVVDAIRSPAIHLSVAIATVLYQPHLWWLALVALGYSLVTSAQFLSQILAEAFVRAAGRPQTRGGNLRSWILLPTDPGTLCWSFLLWGLAPWAGLSPFALLYTALAAIAVAHALMSMRRRYRDLTALDRNA